MQRQENAIAEAVALTSSRAVAVENGSHSVLPGNANATDDEIDAIMKKQKDLPVGNTKEERKKGVLFVTVSVPNYIGKGKNTLLR